MISNFGRIGSMKFSQGDTLREAITGFIEIIKKTESYIGSLDFTQISFSLKEDGSPVSSLDIAIENFVQSELAVALPDFKLIGEESEFPSLTTGNYLVVDPIDGTENFISGIPIWGTGFALIVQNNLVASWIFFPEISISVHSKLLREELDLPIHAMRKPFGISRVRGFSSNTEWGHVSANLHGEIRVFGCSLFNILLASEGAISYKSSEKGVRLWDVLPAALFALESGKLVLINGEDYRGQFLDPNLRFVVEISESKAGSSR
jgi:myo-inositol-1(or 4)-monophosphatase